MNIDNSINPEENVPYRVAKSNCLPATLLDNKRDPAESAEVLYLSYKSFSRTTFHMWLVQIKSEGSKEQSADIEKQLSQCGPLYQ